jgi:hypothetical protein
VQEMNIPVAFQPFVEVFKALDGHGQLWSPTGQFLGRLSSDPHNKHSIINPQGVYGSPFSEESIHNPRGFYGGEGGIYSPFNPNCINPPVILYQSQPRLILTSNLNVFTNGLKAVDPYLMLAIYEELSNATPKSVAKPLVSASQERQINAKTIGNVLTLGQPKFD